MVMLRCHVNGAGRQVSLYLTVNKLARVMFKFTVNIIVLIFFRTLLLEMRFVFL